MVSVRRMHVLRAVVEDYIRSQEPIGSASLSKRHDLKVSPATIRNDMAKLEDEGYLMQPHTSAGRIPTEKGYRYFVDTLASLMPLSPAQRHSIDALLRGSVNLQDALSKAAHILAQITGQIAVISSPMLASSVIKRIELVSLAQQTLLFVIIMNTGRVVQHTVRTTAPLHSEAVERVNELLNQRCEGLSLLEASELVARHEADLFEVSGCNIAAALQRMGEELQSEQLYTAGTSQLAHQYDFADMMPLFDALEEQVAMMKLVSSLSLVSSQYGVSVAIGSELHEPNLRQTSIVSSGYGMKQESTCASPEPVAFVGSIGPTHMDYMRTMMAVQAIAHYLTSMIAPEAS